MSDDEPIGADDLVRAARDEVSSYVMPADRHQAARFISAAVLRALSADGDTWEADQLDAMADEIEEQP